MRQHPPGAAAPGQVEHGVDDLTKGVGTGPAGRAVPPREEVFDVLPLEIGEVAGIALTDGRGIHARVRRHELCRKPGF